MPELLHLVLITRTNPNFSLALLRARNELLEVDTNDLRFNVQETESFLKTATQTDVDSLAVENLFQKTEGWIAGLQLAALSLRGKKAEEAQKFVQTFSGNQRYVSEYLIKEVFENQVESVQEFLLKTCFLKT